MGLITRETAALQSAHPTQDVKLIIVTTWIVGLRDRAANPTYVNIEVYL